MVHREETQAGDAELLLVAYGYVARCCEGAINMARAEGLRVGLIRPITLWPFAYEITRQKASVGCRFLVLEDSMGQMIEDPSPSTRHLSLAQMPSIFSTPCLSCQPENP